MSFGTKVELTGILEKANSELLALAHTTETEIRTVAGVFEGLAGHADAILSLAGAIVGCVESESVVSVLPKVRELGAVARRFIAERLQATAGILETVTTEVQLLRELSLVTRGQKSIAFETKALSVLTNIEVAHLGAVASDFQYLAQELADFSRSVIKDNQELSSHTENRIAAIEETRHVLIADLPLLREEMARIDVDLGNALAIVDSGLTQLARTPLQFRACVEEITQQIAGVVAAVQAHDITRQQIEHVQEAFERITGMVHGDENSDSPESQEMPRAYAGLTIQIYQLRAIKDNIANWSSQIRTCMDGILRVSASDVVGIGPAVLEQERQVSSQLAQIEKLECESQAYGERIRSTLGGLSNLMQLVSEHVQRSKSVREALQLLTFNSIIEASRLGKQADGILAIANSIKGISTEWIRSTDNSGNAMKEILKLATHSNQVMATFSDESNKFLRDAQVETRAGLDNLRTAAEFAARQGHEVEVATGKLQRKIAEAGNASDALDACSGLVDAVLNELERALRQFENDVPQVKEQFDAKEVEQLFSASYTTEMERDVLRAALYGTPMPVAQQSFAGNSVELF